MGIDWSYFSMLSRKVERGSIFFWCDDRAPSMKYSCQKKKTTYLMKSLDLTPNLKEILGQHMLNNTNPKLLAKFKMWDILQDKWPHFYSKCETWKNGGDLYFYKMQKF